MMSIADEIAKMDALRKNGAITDEEYDIAKAALLEKAVSPNEPVGGVSGRPNLSPSGSVSGGSAAVNNYAMFIHLSCLCGLVVPLAGLVVPIVLWQVKKHESRLIDLHGKIVMNWIITMVIAAFVCGILTAMFIGVPMLFALGVVGIVFPIIGGVKANNGEVWRYPLAIKFLSET